MHFIQTGVLFQRMTAEQTFHVTVVFADDPSSWLIRVAGVEKKYSYFSKCKDDTVHESAMDLFDFKKSRITTH